MDDLSMEDDDNEHVGIGLHGYNDNFENKNPLQDENKKRERLLA
jgi:hypothetical protein